MADYKINDLYQGGYSSLDPESSGSFMGYRVSAGGIGMATDPRTANILQEATTKLSSGVKTIELSTIQPNIIEAIPKQHFKEINRLSKLTGVDMTVHGPLIEPSGFNPQQGAYNEYAREEAERQMLSAIEKAHEVSPDGNVPVTFHSSVGWNGPEYKKLEKEEAKRLGMDEQKVRIPIINQDTGQMTLAKVDTRYQPGMTAEQLEQGERISAEENIRIANNTEWTDSITSLVSIKERADRMISETEPIVNQIQQKIDSGTDPGSLTSTEREVFARYQNAGLELGDIQKHLSSLFEKAYKHGNSGKKKILTEISENFRKDLSGTDSLSKQSEAMGKLMQNLYPSREISLAPETYKPVEDFLLDKTAATFGNVAFNSYKKFKDKAPILSIENPPTGGGYSRAEDLKNVVEKAQDKFIENAVKEGMKEKEARNQAKKLIGVTWDVGHINMLRKYGYTEEDVIKESEKLHRLLSMFTCQIILVLSIQNCQWEWVMSL